MRKVIKPILIFGAGVIIALGLRALLPGDQTTLVSLSPDARYRVRLVEIPAFIDRNFELRLEDMESGETLTIFRSPDEGRPVGSERIVWSADARRFLLLGRRFTRGLRLPSSGDLTAYIMYDVVTEEMWCAAGDRGCASLSVEDVTAIDWELGL